MIIIDSDFVLNMFSNDKRKSLNSFIHYNNEVNADKCLEIEKGKRVADEETRTIIKKVCKIKHVIELQKFNKMQRDTYLRKLKKQYNFRLGKLKELQGSIEELYRNHDVVNNSVPTTI
ncbi:hypothetical protein [Brassicibacter mesophilus]|uniref:hypothetical protein n=1 Tax=Brassicibacter mesophilus TaxID=745119 RepID=UPI003D1AD901